jgi:hypothetical protein
MESDSKNHAVSIQPSVTVSPTSDPGPQGSGRNSKNGIFVGSTVVHAQPQASSMHSNVYHTDIPNFISIASPHDAPVLVPPLSESRVSLDARARGRPATLGPQFARGDTRFERSFSARNPDGEVVGEAVQGELDGVAEAARLKQKSLKSLRRTIRFACILSLMLEYISTASSMSVITLGGAGGAASASRASRTRSRCTSSTRWARLWTRRATAHGTWRLACSWASESMSAPPLPSPASPRFCPPPALLAPAH